MKRTARCCTRFQAECLSSPPGRKSLLVPHSGLWFSERHFGLVQQRDGGRNRNALAGGSTAGPRSAVQRETDRRPSRQRLAGRRVQASPGLDRLSWNRFSIPPLPRPRLPLETGPESVPARRRPTQPVPVRKTWCAGNRSGTQLSDYQAQILTSALSRPFMGGDRRAVWSGRSASD